MSCPKRSFFFSYRLQVLLSTLVLFAACSQETISPAISSSRTAPIVNIKSDKYEKERTTVIKGARRHLGKNYKYSGTGPDHWDCSGLTINAFEMASIGLPRTARDMSKLGEDITIKEAKSGDLIFFAREGRVFHVSIVTENTGEKLWVVHSTTSRGVIEEDILASTYWSKKVYKVISLAALKER